MRVGQALFLQLFKATVFTADIQSDLSNGASFRGTAVPAVITGGTPVPRFMSLCIVEGRKLRVKVSATPKLKEEFSSGPA